LTNSRKSKNRQSIRSKLAQVRGIDFALAMLIFIIAFSQIIIVLSNLLIPTMVQMQTFSKEQELNKLYSNIFQSQGHPANWAAIGTNDITDFRLGLLATSNSLDFTKINRLVPGISDYWLIDYTKVKLSYTLTRDFAIEIFSPIEVSIDNYNVAFNQITIYGSVSEYQTSILDAKVWVYVVNADNEVFTNYTMTKDLSGSVGFISTFNVNVTTHYSVVALAQVGDIYQDYTLLRLTNGGVGLDYYAIDFDYLPTVRESSAVETSAVDVSVSRSVLSDEAYVFTLFPFTDLDVNYFKQALQKVDSLDEGPIYAVENIPVPAKGFSVVLVQEFEDTVYRAGYMGVPMFLSSSLGTSFGPYADLNQLSHISETYTMFLQNMLVKCQIWYW